MSAISCEVYHLVLLREVKANLLNLLPIHKIEPSAYNSSLSSDLSQPKSITLSCHGSIESCPQMTSRSSTISFCTPMVDRSKTIFRNSTMSLCVVFTSKLESFDVLSLLRP